MHSIIIYVESPDTAITLMIDKYSGAIAVASLCYQCLGSKKTEFSRLAGTRPN
jgi:hypothetical protein